MKGLIFWIIVIMKAIAEFLASIITIEFVMAVVYGCLILSIIYLVKGEIK